MPAELNLEVIGVIQIIDHVWRKLSIRETLSKTKEQSTFGLEKKLI